VRARAAFSLGAGSGRAAHRRRVAAGKDRPRPARVSRRVHQLTLERLDVFRWLVRQAGSHTERAGTESLGPHWWRSPGGASS